jgi:deoxyadenosine/deoxycytidine kinase
MKLIIIHGPPAGGKLTVANEIAKRTGFKVFHNHLSIDCVKPVFDFGTRPFGRLIELIRVETIAEAARENVDLIHTFVYAKGPDDEHFAKLIAAFEENGGQVCVVLLSCDPEEGKRRVTSESRSRMGKVATPEMLDSLHKNYDLLSPLDGRETLVIDNSNLSAMDAAERIIGHFELPLQLET